MVIPAGVFSVVKLIPLLGTLTGDWFYHQLDSSDQALLTVCLYTDVVPDGGPTLICPKALPRVLKWMFEHPKDEWSGAVLNGLRADIDDKEYIYVSAVMPPLTYVSM